MRTTPVSESRLIAYSQVLQLAKSHLVTLGGDNREDPHHDTIQGSLLDLIEFLLDDMVTVMGTLKDPMRPS